ncbi:hypothetical protein SAMN04488136_1257 [Vibrio xiamenensis]|uniref:Chromosome partitioning protein ParA n=1 Tax=Vibrio xiamenensis TaxID=861298 RepID=A0A1G8EJG2_9VIBR|nr:chromosome partitioning protein ParA [Vibrio xiamenensis]SDH70018.1 hypothetical protein SAMN04488136_1257 [Vibrio xiamenensis]
MVSINGLPPAQISNASKAKKSDRKRKSQNGSSVGEPTKVANAVANTIRHVQESDIHRAQIEYDLPEGSGRKAMEKYMDVMNQARREELTQLLGVDIYI